VYKYTRSIKIEAARREKRGRKEGEKGKNEEQNAPHSHTRKFRVPSASTFGFAINPYMRAACKREGDIEQVSVRRGAETGTEEGRRTERTFARLFLSLSLLSLSAHLECALVQRAEESGQHWAYVREGGPCAIACAPL
jgi:hypothetical protein